MDPETQGLRTSYYLGFYNEVLKEAKELKTSNDNADIYYYRALMVPVLRWWFVSEAVADVMPV